MSDIAYRGLLFEIGKKLTQHDRQQLLVVCGLEDEADNIPDAHLLLERLHEKGLLEIDQLGVLEEVLATLDESSLLEKLKEFEKKRKEYTNLLAKVSDALDSDERNHLEQLKDICKRETSLELDESISEIRTLFKELEKHGRLGFRTLDFLKKILTEIEREDLVKEIEEYEERRNKNDAGERRKAKLYSWGKAGIEKAAQVPLKTWVEAFGRVVSYNDILGCFKSVGQCFRIFDERVLIPDTELVNMSRGSVCFTVQANSLKGLTTLWKMYQDGTLRARLYDFLVTEVKHFAEAEENVELTVTIEEEDYKRAFIYLNNEAKGPAKVPGRKCEDSDSVISTTPNEDETLQVKVKRLENDFQLLMERVENQETQTTGLPIEFLETRMGKEIIPAEEVQNASYERLADKTRGIDEHKWNFTKMHVESLQFETKSLMSEASDSGMGTEGAPSVFDMDIGDKRDTQTIAGDDWNSLSSVVQIGNFAIIENMLSRGLDINTKNNDGNTVLILAASTGKRDAVNYLLDKGADPFIVGHSGITPLHAASKADNVTIIETLMSRGLDVDLKDSGGSTPLMWAAVCGKIEAVNYLLDKGADPSIRDQSGRNSLHVASEGGNVTIIETLMSRGLDVDLKDNIGRTPLMWAAVCGKIEAVNYLLDNGADPSIRDPLGGNLLHTASEHGNVTIIETLMSRGLDVDSKDSEGRTPLMMAAVWGKIEAINCLLDNGADPSIRNKSGRNLLHAAAMCSNVAIITKMLSLGLDVNSKDFAGCTPLEIAKAYGKTEAVTFLLSKGGHWF